MLEYDWENSVGHWVCATSHAMRRALSDCLTDEGMTFRQWEVLAWLSVKGGMSQAELSDCLGIEPHTVTGVLRRMERDGWLERRCCETDRRKNQIFPTEKSEAVWSRAVACCHRVRDQAVQGISAEELVQFKKTCETIRSNLVKEDASDVELTVQIEDEPVDATPA
ncbi:MAG: MarR family transcriptional regulator [Planctomycetota bacterium]|nr:MAG: MarR family transcriptional regulator [Planctomycetota bacterium]REJ93771.1 MAG: MarR family transcriptional regulator [Planctomycetota bacterium]REK20330.1 MAG: MarR family transcriptional regulator [Planctomycetota bacterium]REK26827.1 MAG: MarR family transcriptional regulator [Planctomycetota bacterium]